MPPHLLDARVLEPLAPFLAALEQRDRARLSLACKGLYAAVLTAGGGQCVVRATHLASFGAWLGRLQAAGGCAAGPRVKLWGNVPSTDDALARLCQVAAVGPSELRLDVRFAQMLDSSQLLQAIQALGASTPCRLRTLCIDLEVEDPPALNAITTLERLECSVGDHEAAWRMQPNLPQLTALVVDGRELSLNLDGVPALRQLALDYFEGVCAATVAASTPLGGLTSLRFNGRRLSFPWQQARRLQELVLFGDEEHTPTVRSPPNVHGIRHLTALADLHSLSLALPLNELSISSTWLGGVTALETHITADARQTGINQALGLVAAAPQLGALVIKDYDASGWHVLCKWAWALMGKAPDSLQSVSWLLRIYNEFDAEEDHERSVVREAGEGTAAMLGRLMAHAGSELTW